MYILTLFNWTSLFLLLYNVTEVNYMQQQYDIGKRLREVMAERGVTISQLAELTDVSEDTIKAIRSGKTKSPGIQLMISIADALGCTMDGFLHRRSLTDEELYLLQKYRTLNIHG